MPPVSTDRIVLGPGRLTLTMDGCILEAEVLESHIIIEQDVIEHYTTADGRRYRDRSEGIRELVTRLGEVNFAWPDGTAPKMEEQVVEEGAGVCVLFAFVRGEGGRSHEQITDVVGCRAAHSLGWKGTGREACNGGRILRRLGQLRCGPSIVRRGLLSSVLCPISRPQGMGLRAGVQ